MNGPTDNIALASAHGTATSDLSFTATNAAQQLIVANYFCNSIQWNLYRTPQPVHVYHYG